MTDRTQRKSELLELYMDNELEVEDLIDKIISLEEKVEQYEADIEEKKKVTKEYSDTVADKLLEFCKDKSIPRIIEEHRRSKA
ncbi:hypothetical protein CHH83_02315 [Bacillus sp. 7586-K]|nr:hypothetical protein CHH83_02315 [Bacillus sp. 7586-K]